MKESGLSATALGSLGEECRAGRRADAERAELSSAPRTKAPTGLRRLVESLTQRELEIARLIVDRQTNRQIAEGLFLSPKTVETHIRNIFGKLGADSRVEVARIVERADRLSPDAP